MTGEYEEATYLITVMQQHVIGRALRMLLDSGQPLSKYEKDALADLDYFYEAHS